MMDRLVAAWCWHASVWVGTDTEGAGAVHVSTQGSLRAGDPGIGQISVLHPTVANTPGTQFDVDAEARPDPEVVVVGRSKLRPVLESGSAIELIPGSFSTGFSPGCTKLSRWRKEKNFRAQTRASVGLKFGEGKNVLIKDNISRDVNTACGEIEAIEILMHVTIP
jgi:hypothetical protein